jgi:hypothetical protein
MTHLVNNYDHSRHQGNAWYCVEQQPENAKSVEIQSITLSSEPNQAVISSFVMMGGVCEARQS